MKLKDLKALNDKIAVYIPSVYKQEIIDTSRVLANAFGGSSISDIKGNWIMDDKTLCSEDVNIIYSYCDKLTDDNIDSIIEHAEKLKIDCKQESILIEVNNKGYLI